MLLDILIRTDQCFPVFFHPQFSPLLSNSLHETELGGTGHIHLKFLGFLQ